MDRVQPEAGLARPNDWLETLDWGQLNVDRYLAWVHHDGDVRIYRNDQLEPVAVVTLQPGVSLRETLEEAGWRLTGRRPRCGGWAALYVRRLPGAELRSGTSSRRAHDADEHPAIGHPAQGMVWLTQAVDNDQGEDTPTD